MLGTAEDTVEKKTERSPWPPGAHIFVRWKFYKFQWLKLLIWKTLLSSCSVTLLSEQSTVISTLAFKSQKIKNMFLHKLSNAFLKQMVCDKNLQIVPNCVSNIYFCFLLCELRG